MVPLSFLRSKKRNEEEKAKLSRNAQELFRVYS